MANGEAYKIGNPVVFMLTVILMGVIGVGFGGGVEKLVTLIPRDSSQNLKCGGLVLLQLSIISVVIYIFTLFSKRNLYSILSNNWQGRLFLLTFFVAQGSISQNIQCLLDISYN